MIPAKFYLWSLNEAKGRSWIGSADTFVRYRQLLHLKQFSSKPKLFKPQLDNTSPALKTRRTGSWTPNFRKRSPPCWSWTHRRFADDGVRESLLVNQGSRCCASRWLDDLRIAVVRTVGDFFVFENRTRFQLCWSLALLASVSSSSCGVCRWLVGVVVT